MALAPIAVKCDARLEQSLKLDPFETFHNCRDPYSSLLHLWYSVGRLQILDAQLAIANHVGDERSDRIEYAAHEATLNIHGLLYAQRRLGKWGDHCEAAECCAEVNWQMSDGNIEMSSIGGMCVERVFAGRHMMLNREGNLEHVCWKRLDSG